jgi:DNA-binding MarR family transcriptional regulator
MTDADRLLEDERLTALGLLEETRSGLQDRFAAQLSAHSLSLLEFEVLLRLARSPGQQLRMSDLASQVMMSASGLTRVADRLEGSGLVERRHCDEDRRGTWASITATGRERLIGALPGHLDLIERWYTGVLTAEEVTQLTCLLRKVRDVVRPGAVAGAQPADES